MKTSTLTELEAVTEAKQLAIRLPLGLLGFEPHKSYVLLGTEEEHPFLWLRMEEEPNQAFLVVPPSAVLPEYEPDLSKEDVAFLGLASAEDAMVLNIVTLHPDGRATINLKGPVVLNRRTWVGKQVIPLNASDYALQHPIHAAA